MSHGSQNGEVSRRGREASRRGSSLPEFPTIPPLFHSNTDKAFDALRTLGLFELLLIDLLAALLVGAVAQDSRPKDTNTIATESDFVFGETFLVELLLEVLLDAGVGIGAEEGDCTSATTCSRQLGPANVRVVDKFPNALETGMRNTQRDEEAVINANEVAEVGQGGVGDTLEVGVLNEALRRACYLVDGVEDGLGDDGVGGSELRDLLDFGLGGARLLGVDEEEGCLLYTSDAADEMD